MAPLIEELQFPNLEIPITIDDISPVMPAGPIQAAAGDCLYLSNLDDMAGARVMTPTVYFYLPQNLTPPQKSFGKILRDALARVLVPYYPFSGRLRKTENEKLEVFFGPNQGALIVEARTNIAISDLGGLTIPNPTWAPLIYRFPNEEPYKVVDMPLVIAQVTSFSCGGFSLGLRLCHCLCDGLGAMQFVSAWAAMARGTHTVDIPFPCWDREFFRPRDPPEVKFPHLEFVKFEDGSSLGLTLSEAKLVQKCYWVSQEFQARLKRLAQSNDEGACTCFDAMAAHVWRSWVQAFEIRPLDYKLRLTFAVNARPRLINPPLKDGFYGNAICVACASDTVARLLEGSLSNTARLVRTARISMSEDYVRSTVDYLKLNRPRGLEFAGKLTITQWTRFSMYESADFGWGPPVYAGPIDLTATPQVCVFLPDGVGFHCGSMVVWICLPENATSRFRECLFQLDKGVDGG
ncbi:HXXXD-type acyl-transferase family protein [Tasmannia lanceolata]|uniref:HXXXD-type acyl-transferase family protein n=1 Tax=Tasmannia lanceolata TaxID=3420 RepID=UPI0040641166